VTSGESTENLNEAIKSIIALQIPKFEIIIIGNVELPYSNKIQIIPFNEDINPGWITKKKNLITNYSNFDLIVYLHDYYVFDAKWYEQVLAFGEDFDISMHQILNSDGTRYHDWALWVENNSFIDKYIEKNRAALIPYNWSNFTNYMYVPGGYWFAKKKIMQKYPLNENLMWGEAEDVEWSKRVRDNAKYTMNHNAIVQTLKLKEVKFKEPNSIQRNNLKLLKFFDRYLN
jgi:hypothetical protein